MQDWNDYRGALLSLRGGDTAVAQQAVGAVAIVVQRLNRDYFFGGCAHWSPRFG